MDPRYPIGRFTTDPDVAPANRRARIDEIAALPGAVLGAVTQLPPGGLERPYRAGGWTARQVVHHLADSHLNAYVRIRLALTEENPIVRTYEETRWAVLHDAKTADPALSITLLASRHARLVALLTTLAPDQFARSVHHPVWGRVDLDWFLQMYAWHGRHHTGHINLVR